MEHNSDRAKIIERVRKLFSLAENTGATEHEAATALEMAQRLAQASGITETELHAQNAKEHFTEKGAASRVPVWENDLAIAMMLAFACEALHHGGEGRWSFIGKDPLPEIAGYAFDVLRRQCLQARQEYIRSRLRRVKSRSNKTKRADLFCQGWIQTAMLKTNRMTASANDKAAIRAFKEIHYPVTKPLKPTDRHQNRRLRSHEIDDLTHGLSAGSNAELNIGVGVGARGNRQIAGSCE